MQNDEKLTKILPRFEAIEQLYDGLNGKIIKWTFENGNTNHDPSILAFVVGPDGKVFSSLMGGQQYQAGSFSKWALEQANAYEKEHPTTRIPFARATVALRGDGTARKAVCSELDDALTAKKPTLLYFGRGSFAPDDKVGKKQAKRARKFEKGTLNSKPAAKVATGWTLLRFDLADEAHALLATRNGVFEAPTLLVFAPGEEKPRLLDRNTSGGVLAGILKRIKTP